MTEETDATPDTTGAPAPDRPATTEIARWWEPLVAVGFTVGIFAFGFFAAQPLGLSIGGAGFVVALTGIIALPQFVFAVWRESSVELNEVHREWWSKFTFAALCLFVFFSGAVARLGLIAG